MFGRSRSQLDQPDLEVGVELARQLDRPDRLLHAYLHGGVEVGRRQHRDVDDLVDGGLERDRDRPARTEILHPALVGGTVGPPAAGPGAPVPAIVGAGFPPAPARGRQAIPVRPALFGSILGVLGVVAAFTFSAGVNDASAHPERFGQSHQLIAFVGMDGEYFGPVDELRPVLANDPDVAVVNDDAVIPDGWYTACSTAMRAHGAAAAASDPHGRITAPLPKTTRDRDVYTRMPGWAFLLRGEVRMRADESLRWWYGDSDLDWTARANGGMVLIPGYPVGNRRANSTTRGVLAEQAGKDRAMFAAKWAGAPW